MLRVPSLNLNSVSIPGKMKTQPIMKLKNILGHKAVDMGARFFGVADLAVAKEAILEQGGEFLNAFPRALSVGIAMSDRIVDQLHRHKEAIIARTYDYLYYTVNQSLDRIALRLSATLSEHGFKSLLVPASDRADTKNIRGLFSHKLAANLAGLGWIGPSCMLITPEIGPRVRWVTVLTDAPMKAGLPLTNGCGDCRSCVEGCPPNAFTGRSFDPSEPRESRFNIQRCIGYRKHLEKAITGVRVCGMCVNVCPIGKEKKSA